MGERMTIDDAVAYLKSQCSHFLHGKCMTRVCFISGGWDGKTTPVPVKPTCEYRLAAEQLERSGADELAKALGMLLSFVDQTGQGCSKPVEDARAALAKHRGEK